MGVILQEVDPPLDDPPDRLVVLPTTREPLAVSRETGKSRAGPSPLGRTLAVVVSALITKGARRRARDA